MRPQGVALPILACAVWLRVQRSGGAPLDETIIEAARICIGPLLPVPCRAGGAEAALAGATLAQGLEGAISATGAEFSPRASKHRSSAAYRREMIAVLLRRTVPLALRRAVTGEAIPEGVGLK
jgi:CO/xanthine dehydrogenase FAD-binding subunit